MNRTSIEWTDFSSNLIKFRDPDGKVVHGCVKVSPGCANCYASAISKRFSGGEFTASRQKTLTPFFDEEEARRILRSRATGKKVFVGDMTDAFGEWVPDWMLDRMFAVFALRPDLVFQVLTKRPERMRAYFSTRDTAGAIAVTIREVAPDGGLAAMRAMGTHVLRDVVQKRWPLPNVWLGTSVENQATADERIPELLATPAAVRFLSCEPLIEEVEFTDDLLWAPQRCSPECGCQYPEDADRNDCACEGECCYSLTFIDRVPDIDWVIVGGESGPGARPCDLAWIRGIVGQCKAAGAPVFVKQGSGPRPGMPTGDPELDALKEFPR